MAFRGSVLVLAAVVASAHAAALNASVAADLKLNFGATETTTTNEPVSLDTVAECKCRSGQRDCTFDNWHKQWCYVDATSSCSDLRKGKAGVWSEQACDGVFIDIEPPSTLAEPPAPVTKRLEKTTAATSTAGMQGSCSGRCNGAKWNALATCQCNPSCDKFNNCCDDYQSQCLTTPSTTTTTTSTANTPARVTDPMPTKPDSAKPSMCCRAMTPMCLAGCAGVTVEAWCKVNKHTMCPSWSVHTQQSPGAATKPTADMIITKPTRPTVETKAKVRALDPRSNVAPAWEKKAVARWRGGAVAVGPAEHTL